MQEHGGAIDALRMALDEPLGDRKHGADRVHDLIVQRAPGGAAVLVADEPRAQTGPAFEQLGAPARALLLDVGAARKCDEDLGGDDRADELVRTALLDALEQSQDLGRVPHAALAEALEMLEQRSLTALELVLANPLDRPHQIAQGAHERQRAGVQRLDLG